MKTFLIEMRTYQTLHQMTQEMLLKLHHLGKNGVTKGPFRRFQENLSNTSMEVSNILNVIKYFKKSPNTWKGAFVRRTSKKSYDPNDLTTLRDISLLPPITEFSQMSSKSNITKINQISCTVLAENLHKKLRSLGINFSYENSNR